MDRAKRQKRKKRELKKRRRNMTLKQRKAEGI